MKKTCTLLIFGFLISYSMIAQYKLEGKVINVTKMNALEDANVILKPINKGTVTNLSGEFVLSDIKSGDYQLVVSSIGYKTFSKFITIDSDIYIKVQLNTKDQQIQDVSILGEGQEKSVFSNPGKEPVSLESSISHVNSIDIIRQGAVTVVDALRYVPGGLTESRGRKVKQFFSTRGQTYPYPTYSIDGIWQKEFHEMAYFINAANVESIEIVRSGSAFLKSLTPLAGVIDIKSKEYDSKETHLLTKYGSLNTYQTSLAHGNKFNDLSYSIGAQVFGTDGPKGRNGSEKVINVDGNVNWKINDHLSAHLKLFYMDGHRQLIQPIEPADKKFRGRKEKYDPIRSALITSKLIYTPSDKFNNELQISYAHRNPKYTNVNLSNGESSSYREEDHELTISQLSAFKLGQKNVLRVGFLYNHWLAPEGKRYYYGNRANVHTFSGVIADQQSFGKFIIDYGFRLTKEYYDEWGGFSIEGSGGKFKNVEPIKNEWQPEIWQSTIGLTYALNSRMSWQSNVAMGIVTPRKGALNSDGEQPHNENRTNFDLGFINHWGSNSKLKLVGFFVNRKDAISLSGETLELENGDFVEMYENSNKRSYGIEMEANFLLATDWLSGFANSTWMIGEEKSNNSWAKDNEIPQFISNVGLNVHQSAFDCNLFVNYTSGFKNDRFVSKDYIAEFGKAPLGDFFAVDFSTGYSFGNGLKHRVFAEVKNVFDEKYQTVPGYPDNGRMLSVGLLLNL